MIKGRTLIEQVCQALNQKIERLEWEPLGPALEMQGPSGGWTLETEAYSLEGYNASEIIQGLVKAVIQAEVEESRSAIQSYGYRRGIANAATEKDSEIEELRRLNAAGATSNKAVKHVVREHVSALIHALWDTTYMEPPMNQNYVLQELLNRNLGDWNCQAGMYNPEDTPLHFEAIPKEERSKFRYNPSEDLPRIYQAAGTQDIDEICAKLGVCMELKPYQRRVVDEKNELDKKAKALSDFIGTSDTFETLDAAEQERLKLQNDIMWQYSEILGERIKAFC